jgi:hypothetical protein
MLAQKVGSITLVTQEQKFIVDETLISFVMFSSFNWFNTCL